MYSLDSPTQYMRTVYRILMFVLALTVVYCGCIPLSFAFNMASNNISQDKANTMHDDLPLLVEKKKFTTRNFKTFGGEIIKEVNVGWESYGTLNSSKDNAILITHYFTGNSHAAGKYSIDDAEAGYWDAIIGPNKAIDTNKFFVISVDSLVNISAYDPKVITTGPASINPDTGKHYGLSFPVVTMRDFVNVQKRVLESLGIQKLYAVAGPSMGSMQAIEWASAYPEKVERLISVIGSASSDPWTSALLEQWTVPISMDINYNNGDYYAKDKSQWPTQGLIHALAFITQSALHPKFFAQVGEQLGYTPLEPATLSDITNKPSIVKWINQRAAERAQLMDANHLLYLVRANQLFLTGMGGSLEDGLANIQAKVLLLPANNDQLLMPYHAEKIANMLKRQEKDVSIDYLVGDLGHLEGLAGIAAHSETIRTFLSN